MTREEKQKAIDALKISAPVKAVTQEEFNDYIQTLNQVMDWLEQEPCEDTISRQEVLSYIYNDLGLGDEENGADIERQKELESSYRYVNSLPPVTPQPKTGYREYNDIYDHYLCGKCKTVVMDYDNFCPNCGAKMQEVEE